MPIRKYIEDESIPAETRQIISAAYDSVLLVMQLEGKSISPRAIADRVAAAVFEGERDAALIAETVLAAFLPKGD